MPIWITESNEKFVIDLIADLNTAEDGAVAIPSHPVSFSSPPFLLPPLPPLEFLLSSSHAASGQSAPLGDQDVWLH